MSPSPSSDWMIYGANGYTGALIAREAARRGLKPVLAGRGESVERLANELGLPSRRFGLDRPELAGMKLVLHCAGPFSATSRPMLDACVAARAHYLDITGEIDVFEAVHARGDELRAAGICAIPGVGFDVVPTDCVAAMLKRELPSASRLALAFVSDGGLSAGTAQTSLEGIALGGRVRRDGRIVEVPIAARRRSIDFGVKRIACAQIPWGDVSTAYHSTGIPNIETYMPMPAAGALVARAAGRLLRHEGLRRLAQKGAKRLIRGPSQDALETGTALIWGEVRDDAGETRVARIRVPQGYRLTVDASLACVERVLGGGVPAGALTPSKAFGAEFVLSLPGCSRI